MVAETSIQLQPVPPGAEPLSVTLGDLKLEGLRWGEATAKPILALHGWLDNALSFVHLAPALVQAGYQVVALDFAGHGLSDWRSRSTPYWLMNNCFEVDGVREALGWSEFTLLGHSMGAGVACLYAASRPECVSQLLLIDGLGTLTTVEADAPDQLTQALQAQAKSRNKTSRTLGYPSFEQAVQARQGGMGGLDQTAARWLCQRGLQPIEQPEAEQRWRWRSDPRLLQASPWRLTEGQNQAFLARIQCPTLFVQAEAGLLCGRDEIPQRFRCLDKGTHQWVPGGHHCHLEDASQAQVAALVVDFLQRQREA